MSMRDLASKLDHDLSLAAINLTATTNATGVDGADALSVTHIVNVGASGDTLSGSVYWTLSLEESDDNSTFTDAADADVIARYGNTEQATNSVVIDAPAEDEAVASFGYIGSKRYSRVVITATGTHTNGTEFAVSCVKESKVVQPTV